jgi:predicted dehydrogenase
MTNQPIYRVGIIGGGRQGTHHARGYHLHPRTEVAAVADTDPENLKLFEERFGVPGYTSYEEMLAKEDLDISAPILPVKVNPDAVIASAEAGVKAVNSEKPLAGSLADADRMIEACASRNIPFAAGLVVSSHPDYRKAYEMAASGEIGEVLRINLYENNKQVGTHGLNITRKFANKSDVDFVVGFVSNDPQGEYEEDYGGGEKWYGWLGGYVRFENGIEAYSSFTGPNYRNIEVVGTRGLITNWNNTGLGLRLFKTDDPDGKSDLREVEGVFKPRPSGERERDEEGWRIPSEVMMTSIDDIVNAIDTGDPLTITTGDDLRHSLEIAIALRESARNGSAPFKLPVEDRSIMMYPEVWRWNYKKDVHGVEWYREQMKEHIKKS